MDKVVERYNRYVTEESTDKTVKAQQEEDCELSGKEIAFISLIDFIIEDEKATFEETIEALKTMQLLLDLHHTRLDALLEKLESFKNLNEISQNEN